LDALARLDDPRVTLRLVGDAARDASHAHEIAEIVSRSPRLFARVSFLGVLEDVPLATELARADALVLPSSLEGYGMVLTEALHAGLPLLCARAAAIPESVRDGGAALLFDSGDELECILHRFTRDPELRIRLQRAADSLAGTLPSWSAAGACFHRFLRSAMRAVATPGLEDSR
jgi:glycosyltransferase involved in cell wall biosynthesis